MKILLTTLNSKYIHSGLSIRYLFEIAAVAGVDADLQEFTINNSRDYIFGEIIRGGYDLVCFSCYIWNIEQVKALCSDLKKARPEMKILLGGPEVSHDSIDFMLDYPWTDFIIRGEGEFPFLQFLVTMNSGKFDPDLVSNLTYREDISIRETEEGPLAYMDKLPFPYAHLDVEKDKIIYYESARGCPFRCTYCLSSLDKTMRQMPMERVKRDLGFLLYKKVRQVKFCDRTFNYDRARANEIWQYIIDNDNGETGFHFEICAELLGSDSFAVLEKARPGLFQFEIGVQTTNPYTFREIERQDKVPEIEYNVKKLKELGNIEVHLDLIAGLPMEDYSSFGRSFDKVMGMGPNQLHLGFLKLLKGTPIRNKADEYEYSYRETAPYEVISSKWMSAIDLVKLKMVEEVLDLYYNRGGFRRTLGLLSRDMEVNPFNLFERIADFFYSRNYQHKRYKKEDLYRIMYKFSMRQEARFRGISERALAAMREDMREVFPEDVITRFEKKGWEI